MSSSIMALFSQVRQCEDEGVGCRVWRSLRWYGRVGQLWIAAVLWDAVRHDRGLSTISDSW